MRSLVISTFVLAVALAPAAAMAQTTQQPPTGTQPNQPPLVNTGPAISPTTNPPIPENPVNGAPTPDGSGTTSDAVDFFPYRNGSQSDPNSGQWPVSDAPGGPDEPEAPGCTPTPEYDSSIPTKASRRWKRWSSSSPIRSPSRRRRQSFLACSPLSH